MMKKKKNTKQAFMLKADNNAPAFMPQKSMMVQIDQIPAALPRTYEDDYRAVADQIAQGANAVKKEMK